MSGPSDARRRWSATGALLAGLLITLGSAGAADPEVDALRQRVDELTRSVEELRDELHSLQGKIGGSAASSPMATPQARSTPTNGGAAHEAPAAAAATAVVAGANAEIAALRTAWKQVRAGVPSEQVKDLLGAPTREFTINGKLAWYYIYPV